MFVLNKNRQGGASQDRIHESSKVYRRDLQVTSAVSLQIGRAIALRVECRLVHYVDASSRGPVHSSREQRGPNVSHR